MDDPERFRYEDFSAYHRLVKGRLQDFVKTERATYPEPVPHCDVCDWWELCNKQRRQDDHLSFVAGLTTSQRNDLKTHNLSTLKQFAECENTPKVKPSRQPSLDRAHAQAKIQLKGRDDGAPCHEILDPNDEHHGFRLLPEPNPGDIFLDFEGDHFGEDGGIEYLTGFIDTEKNTRATGPQTARKKSMPSSPLSTS